MACHVLKPSFPLLIASWTYSLSESAQKAESSERLKPKPPSPFQLFSAVFAAQIPSVTCSGFTAATVGPLLAFRKGGTKMSRSK